MLNINKDADGSKLTIGLQGRLDTTTAPQLDEEVKQLQDKVTDLNFDMTDLQYISSAGLRVLLSAQKLMNKQGSMTITNVSPEIMEIFDVTGFCDILTIK
ncbi:MAG: STAS domain-containing protein [Lachnospiraceae bacterium]|nr:STAS domain-containing protein [Lachnospiraceae bacterium]